MRHVADSGVLRPKAGSAWQRRQMEAQGRLQAELDQAARQQQVTDDMVFREAFRIIDVDGSGTIEAPEVLKTLKTFDRKVNGTAFWDTFRSLDLDHSCALDMHEFVAVMLRITEEQRKARRFGKVEGVDDQLDRNAKLGLLKSVQARHRQKQKRKAALDSGGGEASISAAEGSQWMLEAIEQRRQVCDLYRKLRWLSDTSVSYELIDPEPDPRLRTTVGRRILADEAARGAPDGVWTGRAAMTGAVQHCLLLPPTQKFVSSAPYLSYQAHRAALDQFAEIFAVDPSTSPRSEDSPRTNGSP